MFKNLDGFKKIKEDADTTVMQHKKGHTITVLNKALPALHQKQLKSLPLHKASGGEIKRYEDGGVASNDNSQPAQGWIANPDIAGVALGNAPETIPDPRLQQAKPGDMVSVPEFAGNQVMSHPQIAAAPAQPQATAAPQAQVPQSGGFGANALGGFGQEQKGITEKSEAEQKYAQASAQTEKDQQQALIDAQSNFINGNKDLVDHISGALKDVKDGKINPNHYQENQSTGSKIATAIGLFLGGFSTPFTHQGNPALEMLNKQIDRDIDAQKAGVNNKMNIYHAYLEQYKNNQIADNMARATQMAIYGSKIKQMAAESGTAMAKANADIAIGQLKNQMIPYVQKANFLQQTGAINQKAQGGQLSALPPEQLVQYSGAPQQDQQKMYDEIKDNQNIANLRPKILDAFQMASSRNPSTSAQGQRAFEGLINTTVKEKEGTARAAAFESIHKTMTPSGLTAFPGENEAKFNTVINYLKANSAAPVAKGYGIDLDNYQSTSTKHTMPVQPVERVDANGKVSLFNPTTKQFLGYK